MSADKTADAIKLNLRLPKALHRKLVQQAKRNNVSLNTEIVNQLEGYEASVIKRVVERIQPILDERLRQLTDRRKEWAKEKGFSLLPTKDEPKE